MVIIKDLTTEIDFRDVMFGYVVEDAYEPTSLKIYIPEICADIAMAKAATTVLYPTAKVFISKAVATGTAIQSNYLVLPLLHTKYQYKETTVKYGQRVLLNFVNKNPKHGYIIALV